MREAEVKTKRGGERHGRNINETAIRGLLFTLGIRTRRWNPKMAEYIFTERNGIYIIDSQKTVKKKKKP